MAYGLRVWDENGNIILDSTESIARLVYTTVRSGTSSGSVTISAVYGKTGVVVFNTINPTGFLSVPLNVSLSGTTLSWSPRQDSSGDTVSFTTLIFVFVYD